MFINYVMPKIDQYFVHQNNERPIIVAIGSCTKVLQHD